MLRCSGLLNKGRAVPLSEPEIDRILYVLSQLGMQAMVIYPRPSMAAEVPSAAESNTEVVEREGPAHA